MPKTKYINDKKVFSAMEDIMKAFNRYTLSPEQVMATLAGASASVIKLLQNLDADCIQHQDKMIADFAESIRLNLENLKRQDTPEA